MKCLLCNKNKPQYTSTLSHNSGISIPIGIQHNICADCFDESLITGVKNVSLLEYNTLEFAKRQQTNYLKRELGLERKDVLTYQEVFKVFKGVGFTESTTSCSKEQSKKVKKITKGYKIPTFDIPDSKKLGESTISVFKVSDIDVFCAKYKKGATWMANQKNTLTETQVVDLFNCGFIKYNNKNEPLFANDLNNKKRPCVRCGEIKGFKDFRQTNHNLWRCLDCESKDNAKYYKENRDQQLASSKQWRKNNRDKINEYKKRSDQKVYQNIRRRLKDFIKRRGKSYSKEVGCTCTELKLHLQSQFRDGMTWENYGSGENGDHQGCWHIDHIIPLAVWEQHGDTQLSPNHYTNLQPLWAAENLSKGSRLE